MTLIDSSIKKSAAKIIDSLPSEVLLVAAAKTRTVEEVESAISSGIKILGYNYVQEAEKIYLGIGDAVKWHMIGHLQQNKVKTAVKIFDMIETIDSIRLARHIDKQCEILGKVMPCLVEINSGREVNKTGVLPEYALELILKLSTITEFTYSRLDDYGSTFRGSGKSKTIFQK